MGEPIKLPDGRIAYGQAQAAIMRGEGQGWQEATGAPVAPPRVPVDFSVVKGIGPEIVAALHNADILTWEDVLDMNVAEIAGRVSGLSRTRTRDLFAMAKREAE